jgi:hypothetical protein
MTEMSEYRIKIARYEGGKVTHENLGIIGRIILKCVFFKLCVGVGGFIWLRIGATCGLL